MSCSFLPKAVKPHWTAQLPGLSSLLVHGKITMLYITINKVYSQRFLTSISSNVAPRQHSEKARVSNAFPCTATVTFWLSCIVCLLFLFYLPKFSFVLDNKGVDSGNACLVYSIFCFLRLQAKLAFVWKTAP